MKSRFTATFFLAFEFATAAVATAVADTPTPKSVVYRGATVIDGTGGAAQTDAAIVTSDERIVAVRSAAGFQATEGQEIVDVHGKFIIPGLVNTHVHVATLADPPVAKAYLRRELYSGVTTVRDMAGDTRLLAELKREAYFGEIASPDIFFVALMAGPEFFVDPRTHTSARGLVAGQVPWMQAITPTTDLKLAVAQARATGATAIKLYADLSAAEVKAITAEAHRQNMLVWAHASVFPARPSDVLAAGVDVVSHSCLLGYQLAASPVPAYHKRVPVDAAKALQPNPTMATLYAAMKRQQVILDATVWVFDSDPTPTCPEGVEDFITQQAYRAGVPISAGTDDDSDWKDADSVLDSEISLLVEKIGMTPADAIRSATLVGARAAGQDKDTGSIVEGKLANFVVLDADPLQDINNVRSVNLVVKRGVRYPRSDYRPTTAEDLLHPH